MTRILITGASGNIASVTLPNLLSSGATIRAMLHDESKAEGLKDMGIETVIADFSKPETLTSAFADVDKVLLITPVSPDAVSFTQNAIIAAKESGNPHIVRISATVAEPVEAAEIGRQRIQEEDALINSGLPYTIIRPCFFMQNTLMAAQTVASDGMIYLPFKEGKLGMMDIRDVGIAAAKILTSNGHENKIYQLTGPSSISLTDIASTLTSVLGKNVSYVNVPLDAAKDGMMAMGMPNWLADMYLGVINNFSENAGDFTTDEFETITGCQARSYEQFARDFATAFGG